MAKNPPLQTNLNYHIILYQIPDFLKDPDWLNQPRAISSHMCIREWVRSLVVWPSCNQLLSCTEDDHGSSGPPWSKEAYGDFNIISLFSSAVSLFSFFFSLLWCLVYFLFFLILVLLLCLVYFLFSYFGFVMSCLFLFFYFSFVLMSCLFPLFLWLSLYLLFVFFFLSYLICGL